MVVRFPEKADFPPWHYFARRAFAWPSWGAPFKEALVAAGAEVVRSGPVQGFVVAFEGAGGTTQVGIDYGDFPQPFNHGIGGSPRGVMPAFEYHIRTKVDLILKLKYDTRFESEYESLPVPVRPAGYVAFNDDARRVGGGPRDLQTFRHMRDTEHQRDVLFCRMNLQGRPIRQQGIAALRRLGVTLDGPGPSLEWRDYMRALSTARWCLNLEGFGGSVAFRTMEYASVGSCVISTHEIESLVLPWGERFSDGQNILFFDEWDDIPSIMGRARDPGLWRRLVEGSRRLYEFSTSPERVGAWWMDQVRAIS